MRCSQRDRAASYSSEPGYHRCRCSSAVRAEVAFARRDFVEVHRRFDQLAGSHAVPADALEVTGRVVVPAGVTTPITVVAWTGKLTGDRARVYTDSQTVDGDIVQAAPDGSFTIHARRGGGNHRRDQGPSLAAARRSARSRPCSSSRRRRPCPGTVAGKNLFGVRAFARFTAGPDNTFVVETPVEKDETFDLAGLPPGVFVTGTAGMAGQGRRVVLAGADADKARLASRPGGGRHRARQGSQRRAA